MPDMGHAAAGVGAEAGAAKPEVGHAAARVGAGTAKPKVGHYAAGVGPGAGAAKTTAKENPGEKAKSWKKPLHPRAVLKKTRKGKPSPNLCRVKQKAQTEPRQDAVSRTRIMTEHHYTT